ncbi:MAG: tyrosine--tRNA ligase [Planctomycetota bacterium]|jgi:tyrosyl-tRNA synthetase
MPSVFDTLSERGFVEQVTHPELATVLADRSVTLYCGFDPTASSLHVGTLVPIMGLAHLQRAGHTPLIVVGGATGMVGDPSGRSDERNLLTPEQVEINAAGIGRQLAHFVSFEGENAARMLNNADWLGQFGYLEWLRDVGKNFSVNAMMAKDSVRRRLEDREHGISYTEFSYMLLQAYDYLHLYRDQDCVLQVGGADQWGNITAGIDLIRRIEQRQAYGMTFRLLATASGEKFGKTAEGSVWLDAGRTGVWDFYQYWVRTDDGDVIRHLKLFTFLPLNEIAELERCLAERPEERAAQRALAREVTAIVHGPEQAGAMDRGAQMLYGQEIRDFSDQQLQSLLADAPTHQVSRDRLSAGIPIVELLVESGMASSKTEARRRLGGGGIYLNNVAVDGSRMVELGDLASPSCIVLRSGKKHYCLIHVA